jgi:hypothetical protein
VCIYYEVVLVVLSCSYKKAQNFLCFITKERENIRRCSSKPIKEIKKLIKTNTQISEKAGQDAGLGNIIFY